MAQSSPKPASPKSPKRSKAATVPVAEKPAKAPRTVEAAKATGLKLRDLVDRVAGTTGAKKPEAKAAVEATLAALAEALKAGADLALPPLGKLRVVKTAEKGEATMMTLKLRHANPAKPTAPVAAAEKPVRKPAVKPLAEDGEDD